MAQALSLEDLKSRLRTLGGFYEREYFEHSEVQIPKGAITQVVGFGKTECTVKFLSQTPDSRVAWIEKDFELYPNGFSQRKLNLQKILFAEAGPHCVWTTLQILGSGLFDIVVLSPEAGCLGSTKNEYRDLKDLRSLRRLQLAAEKSKTSLIFLLDQTLEAWPISLSLRSVLSDDFRWEVIKATGP